MLLSLRGKISPVCCPDHVYFLGSSELDMRIGIVMSGSIILLSVFPPTFIQDLACRFCLPGGIMGNVGMFIFYMNYTHTFPASSGKLNTF